MPTTNQGNAVVSNERYFAYGRTRYGGIGVTDQRFTGQKRDGTGLQYFNARYYDPELGQFLSPDTLVPDPTNLFDYNRYMYTRGNPMKYNDPTGHCATLDNGDADLEGDHDCWALAYQIYGYGLTSQQFAEDWQVSPDAWLDNVAKASFADVNFLTPFFAKYQTISDARTGQTQGVPNPAPPSGPDCSQIDCASVIINGVVVFLDNVSLYTSGGAAGAQSVAIGCGALLLVPCAAAAEGVAGTLGMVSTVASVAGTGLTAVQVARQKATVTDLTVSATSTLLGATGADLLGNAGAREATAKLGGASMGFGVSLLQYKYDTK